MDIWLIKAKEWTHVRPTSVHGMLWLQTHFENDYWDAISSHKVKLPNTEAGHLSEDAKKAGLILNCVQSSLNAKKF